MSRIKDVFIYFFKMKLLKFLKSVIKKSNIILSKGHEIAKELRKAILFIPLKFNFHYIQIVSIGLKIPKFLLRQNRLLFEFLFQFWFQIRLFQFH